jgi:hypothetical protein
MSLDELDDRTARPTDAAEPLGKIIAVSGSKATVGILPTALGAGDDVRTTVSKFVMVHSGKSRLIGVVTEISLNLPPFDNAAVDGYAVRHADLDPAQETRLTVSAQYPSIEVRDMVMKTGMAKGAAISYDRLEDVVRELQQA